MNRLLALIGISLFWGIIGCGDAGPTKDSKSLDKEQTKAQAEVDDAERAMQKEVKMKKGNGK